MKVEIKEIDLVGIKKGFALELKNEILKATKNELHFSKEYPALRSLFKLIQGSFDSSVNGVHFLSSND